MDTYTYMMNNGVYFFAGSDRTRNHRKPRNASARHRYYADLEPCNAFTELYENKAKGVQALSDAFNDGRFGSGAPRVARDVKAAYDHWHEIIDKAEKRMAENDARTSRRYAKKPRVPSWIGVT